MEDKPKAKMKKFRWHAEYNLDGMARVWARSRRHAKELTHSHLDEWVATDLRMWLEDAGGETEDLEESRRYYPDDSGEYVYRDEEYDEDGNLVDGQGNIVRRSVLRKYLPPLPGLKLYQVWSSGRTEQCIHEFEAPSWRTAVQLAKEMLVRSPGVMGVLWDEVELSLDAEIGDPSQLFGEAPANHHWTEEKWQDWDDDPDDGDDEDDRDEDWDEDDDEDDDEE